jgi:hypothetical protein
MSTITIWLIAAISALSLSFGSGWSLANKQYDSSRLAMANQVIETNHQVEVLNTKLHTIITDENTHVTTIYRTITKLVPASISVTNSNADCNLSDASIRLFQSAASGSLPNTSSTTHGTTSGLASDTTQ